jgi:hypothetical protein
VERTGRYQGVEWTPCSLRSQHTEASKTELIRFMRSNPGDVEESGEAEYNPPSSLRSMALVPAHRATPQCPDSVCHHALPVRSNQSRSHS